MNIDPSKLFQAVIDQLVVLVPLAGALVAAWLARRTALIRDVKKQAVAAEMALGPKRGGQKHAVVRERIKNTWPMARTKTIDSMIKTHGVEAAHAFRDSRRPGAP